jgi:hypothetical protein
MPYVLRSDGVDDVVQIASAITISSLGTQAWTFRYKGVINTVTGTTGIAGTSSSSTVAGPAVGTSGQMIIRSSANIVVATSPNGFVIFGEDHKYECDHLAGGAISWKRDDVEIGTGSYTGSQAWTNINQFFRATSAATTRLSADTEYIEFVGTVNANKWDATLNVTGTGTTLPSTSGTNQGTLVNFTVPDCWVFISTGVAFEGTLGKTSLTPAAKALAVSAGFQSVIVKSNIVVSLDQLAVTLGAVNVLSKNAYTVALKQLSVTVGANVSFEGLIGKTNYPVGNKQLSVNAGASLSVSKQALSVLPKPLTVSAGWSAGVQKQQLTLSGKQEGISIGHLLSINEQHLTIQNKQLQLVTGTSVSFLGELNKTTLNLSPKQLSVLTGTAVPLEVTLNKSSLILTPKQLGVTAGTSLSFNGTLAKTSYNLSGKTLSNVAGTVLTLQKQALQIVSKQLSMGDAVYPIVPVERVFTFTDKNNRTYVFKQTTNIYVMNN